MPATECLTKTCHRAAYADGYCATHHHRVKLDGENHPQWRGDDVGYSGAHQRVLSVRGPASQFTCECGRPAQQWSMVRTDGSHMPYSSNPDDYVARCTSCHKRYDLEHLLP